VLRHFATRRPPSSCTVSVPNYTCHHFCASFCIGPSKHCHTTARERLALAGELLRTTQFSLLLDRDIGLLKHLKIFALLPLSDFRLEAFNLSALDEDIVINEFFSEYVSKESIVF
jgi:hypothetical protein